MSGQILQGRILLAEDDPDQQRLIAHYLRRAGAEVEIVVNGQGACEMALAAEAIGRPFDVILMDGRMPVLDGSGATARLREAGYRRPIIALGEEPMAGADDVASKLECETLTDVIRRYL